MISRGDVGKAKAKNNAKVKWPGCRILEKFPVFSRVIVKTFASTLLLHAGRDRQVWNHPPKLVLTTCQHVHISVQTHCRTYDLC